jgi:hypothetical protein
MSLAGDGVNHRIVVLFYNVQDWKEIWQKAGDVNSAKARIIND